MKDRLFISVTKVFPMLRYLDGLGISRKMLCAKAGLTVKVFESPDNRLSLAQLDHIFQTVHHITGDELIGLHMGRLLTNNFSHILGYVMMNCTTLLHALEKFSTYERLIDETTVTRFYKEKNSTVIESVILDKSIKSVQELAEYKLSGSYSYARLLTDRQIHLMRVEFMHDRSAGKQVYNRIFGCNVYFRQPRNALVMDSACLELPIREPNPQLLKVFEADTAALLKSVNAQDSFSSRTSREIISTAPGILPGIEEIAGRQAVSVRTLQMKLNEEGTSYRKLFNEIKRSLAIRYLKDQTIAISEIAYLLGFSEVSSFHRSFKRWTDNTPYEFRKKQKNSRQKRKL